MTGRTLLTALLVGGAAVVCLHTASAAEKVFRAGAAVVDVTPPKFPVIVNGYTFERTASKATDRLSARALVIDDGACRVAVVVVDSCVLPRTLLDRAKELARKATGIPTGRMLISATHTHSAPSAMPVLGSREDPDYAAWLPGRIAEAVVRAQRHLAPARVGWTVASAPELTHCRLWIMAPGSVPLTSFGEPGKRILMVPPYAGPANIGPAGPVDSDVTLLSVQSPGGRPIALLANYGMHFYGAGVEPLSADWCGQFCEQIQARIAPDQAEPRFVAIMSQGTSGDQHWMDFSRPAKKGDHKSYATSVVKIAHAAYQGISYHDWVPLAMRERQLTLQVRKVPKARLAWAKPIAEKLGDRIPRTREEVYAREQILLNKTPSTRTLKLQALRIGELAVTAIPCEVYGITGLRLKAQSSLAPTMNIELANGEEGYIPPPEQHALGGYSTWEARTACLEKTAEPKIVEAVLGLLENVSGQPRRKATPTPDSYAQAVLASKPLAYWRLEESGGPTAFDATGVKRHATHEGGVARWLDGPQFSGETAINRCPHFAGGRLCAAFAELKHTYTIELWFWDGMPGTGRLLELDGQPLSLKTISPKTWHHLALVRAGEQVTAYLDGSLAPGVVAGSLPAGPKRIAFAAGFEGKLDEIAIYDRALTPDQIGSHYQQSAAKP
ncbi:MAG: LamG-like jellyroll fold domain-containing protein [Verrucomicrobiia bacterium]